MLAQVIIIIMNEGNIETGGLFSRNFLRCFPSFAR
jgi:hypothetical protein